MDRVKNNIESFVSTVHRFSCEIGLQLGIEKCGIIFMRSGQLVSCDGFKHTQMETR